MRALREMHDCRKEVINLSKEIWFECIQKNYRSDEKMRYTKVYEELDAARTAEVTSPR
jgi:hypothetical protein